MHASWGIAREARIQKRVETRQGQRQEAGVRCMGTNEKQKREKLRDEESDASGCRNSR